MKIRRIFFLAVIFMAMIAAKNDKPAYILYNTKGKAVEYADLLKAASEADIVLFGESHTNPVCHWLELQLTKDLYQVRKEKLMLGAEMFETDNTLLLKEYLSKMIRKKDFETEAKLWKNYATDYAPIVDYARENGIPFVATNIPRRYAALVNIKGLHGLDSITAQERGLIASLPIKYDSTLDCYKKMGEATADAGPMHGSSMHLAEAQAIKDATMAYFIMKSRTAAEDITFLHFNGSYHSDNYQGIVWYIREIGKRGAAQPKVVTISTAEQKDITELEEKYKGVADFIICIPDDMTKTN